jgi:hypothetical protein
MNKSIQLFKKSSSLMMGLLVLFPLTIADADARGGRGGGGRGGRSSSNHRSVNRSVNRNVNRNVNNGNRNVNVDRSRHVDVDIDRHGGRYNHRHVPGLAKGIVIGSILATRPYGYRTVYYDDDPYYYYDGTYYQDSDSDYMVIAPPLGIIVPYYPRGAVQKYINGAIYYEFSGLYYKPVLWRGVTQYRTVAL